jgi:hypothetical protein
MRWWEIFQSTGRNCLKFEQKTLFCLNFKHFADMLWAVLALLWGRISFFNSLLNKYFAILRAITIFNDFGRLSYVRTLGKSRASGDAPWRGEG